MIWHLFVGDLSRGEICSGIKPPLYAILGWKWFQSFVTLVFAEWGRVNSQFQKKSVHSSRSLSMTHMSVPLVKAPNNREKSTWRPSINNLSNFFVGAGREDQQIIERWCLKEVKNESQCNLKRRITIRTTLKKKSDVTYGCSSNSTIIEYVSYLLSYTSYLAFWRFLVHKNGLRLVRSKKMAYYCVF